jgi:hypothetical protein
MKNLPKVKPGTLLFGLLSLLLLLTLPISAVSAAQDIRVNIDGLELKTDVAPLILNSRTMLPFRAIAEALNLEVDWEAEQQIVCVKGDNLLIEMQVGNRQAQVNAQPKNLDSPPVIISGRTMAPVRFVSETFGCTVQWDPISREVSIKTPPAKMEITAFYALGDQKTSSWTNLFGRPYPERATGNTGLVDTLALGWYTLDEEGNLLSNSSSAWQRPPGWEKVLEAADEYGLQTEMIIHMTDSNARIRNLIRSDHARQKAIAQIATEAVQYNGVNLDLEGLGWNDSPEQLLQVRRDFTDFVKALADELKKSGLVLTLCLHPSNSAYPGYDYQALGKIADRIIIMAYDYGSSPEPVPMVYEAVESAAAQVAPEKLLLGISVPNENPESIRSKIGIAKRFALKGIALWRLGLISEEMWQEVGNCIAH